MKTNPRPSPPGGSRRPAAAAGIFRGIAWAVCLALIPCAAPAETGDIHFRLAAGGGYPFADNLRRELSLQGATLPAAGYSAGVSLGRSLHERRWGAELWFDVARWPSFKYRNDHEDFDGYISDYSFVLVGKRNLLPGFERAAAFLGAGLGYGRTAVARGTGKVDGIRALALLQFESPLRDNISLLVEGVYLSALGEKTFDSPFLAAARDDRILGSDGEPLGERFASLSLRLGIVVRLVPPSPYYR